MIIRVPLSGNADQAPLPGQLSPFIGKRYFPEGSVSPHPLQLPKLAPAPAGTVTDRQERTRLLLSCGHSKGDGVELPPLPGPQLCSSSLQPLLGSGKRARKNSHEQLKSGRSHKLSRRGLGESMRPLKRVLRRAAQKDIACNI